MTRYIEAPDAHDDYDVEPIPGLPAALPEGERMLWSGQPGWGGLAVHAFHTRKVAIYFGALMAWRFAEAKMAGATAAQALSKSAGLLPLAVVAVAILLLLAYAYARTTIYTITTKRVVIRSGVALPVTLNLPFARIDGAGLKLRANGSGDLPLKPNREDRVPILACWPHCRPWRWTRPEPMLRAVPDAAHVAELLGAALAGAPVTARFPQRRAAAPDALPAAG